MSIATLPRGDTTPAQEDPIPAPRSWSWRLIGLGVALVILLLGVTALILSSFAGAFSRYVVAQVELPANSTAVGLNAPVEYRNVTVGTVVSEGSLVPGGLISVTVHLQPSMLHLIPAGVQATDAPVSFFGDYYVVLVPPTNIGVATLRAGATIPPLRVGQTASLQATLGDLDTLLTKLQPGEFDAALTALAGSLQGNGTSLGQNFVRANNYFQQMLPLWPTVVANLDTLVPVANQFAASTPDILDILANQTITANTVNDQAGEVRAAISGGATLTGELAGLLSAIQAPYAVLAADSGPFLKAISNNPEEISELLAGLDAWARAWTTAEASGPYLSLTENQVVANPADLGLAVLGGPQAVGYLAAGLGAGTVDPPTYTSAGAVPSDPASVTTSSVKLTLAASQAPVLSEPAQSQAVSQIVEAVNGQAPASTAVSTLLLSPVLESLVNGS